MVAATAWVVMEWAAMEWAVTAAAMAGTALVRPAPAAAGGDIDAGRVTARQNPAQFSPAGFIASWLCAALDNRKSKRKAGNLNPTGNAVQSFCCWRDTMSVELSPVM